MAGFELSTEAVVKGALWRILDNRG
jgi:hypothetical protein